MKKQVLYILAFCGSLSAPSYAQLVNSGQTITLSDESLLFVGGEFVNKKGTVLNNGTLEVKGNLTNSDLNSVVFDKQSNGVVSLSGGFQEVNGLNIVFPTLTLSNDTKSLNTSIEVRGALALGNQRLDANDNTIHITNPNPDALLRGDLDNSSGTGPVGTGFITTGATGRGTLIRNTNTDLPYLFPLGSVALNNLGLTTLYRPLHFKPENSFPNTFSASLVFDDPTNSGYDKTKKRYDVKNVSDKYYYLLGQKAGTSKFDVTFYQNSKVDDNYTQLVSWGNYLQWEKAAKSTVASATPDDGLNAEPLSTSIQYSSIETFQNSAFTFSSELGGVNPFTFYNAFSPDGDNKNDLWTIHNIELYPDNKLTIYNRWGDEVYSAKGYSNDRAWDGGDLQSGTYYYVLTATIENQSRVFKGFITMIKKN